MGHHESGWLVEINPITVYNADNRVQFNSDIHVTALSRFYNRPTLNRDGWQADLGLRNNRPGYDSWTYLRARDNGGVEIINSAYNAVTWSVDDWGTMYMRGQETLRTDGNLRLGWRGRWLGDEIDDIWKNIGGKADRGATCQPTGEQAEFGPISQRLGTWSVDCPDSWVMMGLRTDDWGVDATPRTLYIRAKRMKNQ